VAVMMAKCACVYFFEQRRPVVMGPCFRRDDRDKGLYSISSAATIVGLAASIRAIIRRDLRALPKGKEDKANQQKTTDNSDD
jgi:hypothetical protein